MTVLLVDAAARRLDVGAVNVERRGRFFECIMRVERAQPVELLREGRVCDFELCLSRDVSERTPFACELGIELRQRLLSGRVDEERGDVVCELVAGRPFDGPVAQALARLENLLDPNVPRSSVA